MVDLNEQYAFESQDEKPFDEKIIVRTYDSPVEEKFTLKQLEEKKVTLVVDPSAREWLAKNGYNKSMGARPMARLIQNKIKKPLADELLFGRLMQGGKVEVKATKEALTFEINDEKVVTTE